jgi:MFS family permease
VGVAPASAGVAVSAGLIMVGTLALVSSPAVGRSAARAAQPAVHEAAAAPEPPRTGLWRAVVAAAGVGLALGAVDLLAVAFADERGRSAVVAWILAALSIGSAVGGLAHGAVSWRIPADRRLPLLALGLGLSLAAAGLSPNLYVLAAAAAVTGLFVAPAITTAYLLADACATANTRTRVGAWVNTALNAGASGGTAATGLLIDRAPLPLVFAAAGLPALAAAASTGIRPGRAPRPPGPAAAAVDAPTVTS